MPGAADRLPHATPGSPAPRVVGATDGGGQGLRGSAGGNTHPPPVATAASAVVRVAPGSVVARSPVPATIFGPTRRAACGAATGPRRARRREGYATPGGRTGPPQRGQHAANPTRTTVAVPPPVVKRTGAF